MAIKETYIKQHLIDNSGVAPIISDDLNIGMCIDSQTGPMEPTLIRSKAELIDLYLTNNTISKSDHITIKHAAKLLQFAPIYVTRAINSYVLPGMTGSGKVCFTDREFNLLGRSYKLEFNEKLDLSSKDTYVVINFIDLLTTGEDGKFTNESKNYLFYVNKEPTVKSDIYKSIKIPNESESQTPLQDLLLGINKELSLQNSNYPEIPPFIIDIKLENDYINLYLGPNCKIVEYSDGIKTFNQINETEDISYIYNNSNHSESSDPNVVDLEYSGKYIVTQNNYISINNNTFYNPGITSTNYTYPGTTYLLSPFKGNHNLENNSDFIKNYLDQMPLDKFLIYCNDEIIKKSPVTPIGFDAVLDIDLGELPEGLSLTEIELVGDKDIISELDNNYVFDIENKKIKILPNTIKLNNIGIKLSFEKTISEDISEKVSICVYTGSIDSNKLGTVNLSTNIKSLHMLALRLTEWIDKNYYDDNDGNPLPTNNMVLLKDALLIKDNILLNPSYKLSSEYNAIYFDSNNITSLITNYDKPSDWKDNNEYPYHVSKLLENQKNSPFNKTTTNKYVISGDKLNNESVLFNNIYIKIYKGYQKTDENDELISKKSDRDINTYGTSDYELEYTSKYVFFIGNYTSDDPDEELIKLSSADMTYSQFLSSLRRAVNKIFKITNTSNGFTLFDYDDFEKYDIFTGISGAGDKIIINSTDYTENNRYTDYSFIKDSERFAVISKYPNKENILSFSYSIDDDRELYNLTISRKLDPIDYSISFVEDKLDDDGISAFIEKINDLNDHIHITTFNLEAKMAESYTSRLFGNDVPVVDAEPEDFSDGFQKFREDIGVYYSFFFDGGVISPVIAKTISQLAIDLWALALITLKDTQDPAQIIDYRNNLGINDCRSWTATPLTIDTTIGSFLTYTSPAIGFLERIFANKGNGREFAPCFGKTNGICNYTPKYKFKDKEKQREPMLNSQINTIVWDEPGQYSAFNLELTMQKADSTLSDASCVRMINASAHLCDQILKDYIGQYNDEDIRAEITSRISEAIKTRLFTNQKYHPDDYRVICNSSNNTNTIISQRQLVVDILYKLRNGIRYINVYHKVYNMTQDIQSI